jgi:hypothetical protein
MKAVKAMETYSQLEALKNSKTVDISSDPNFSKYPLHVRTAAALGDGKISLY